MNLSPSGTDFSIPMTVVNIDYCERNQATLRTLMEQQDQLCLIGQFATGKEALIHCPNLNPSAIIIHYVMDFCTLDLLKTLKVLCPSSFFILVTMSENSDWLQDGLTAGASWFMGLPYMQRQINHLPFILNSRKRAS